MTQSPPPGAASAIQQLPLLLSEPWALDVQAFCLDCDGTLVDSNPTVDRAVATAVTGAFCKKGHRQVEHTPAQIKARFRDQTYQQILSTLGQDHGLVFDADELDIFHREYQTQKVAMLLREVRAAPGVELALEKLRRTGKILAVVSSSNLPHIHACLQSAGLNNYFQAGHVFSASDSLEPPSAKPSPDVYVHALKMLDIRPEQALAIEDSGSGIQAAFGAGFSAVVAYGGCLLPDEHIDHEAKCRALGNVAYMRHWHELLQD